MTHTPGPWRIDDGDNSLRVRNERFCIALVTGGLDDDSDENWFRGPTAKANAHLLAAAPELLAALTDLWQWATETRTHLGADPVPDGLGANVIAAIAKAEGQS